MKNNRARLFAAAALVASVLPIGATTAPAHAAAVPFGGFTAESWSTPIRVEVYEPSIPVPATPQAEFELGYSKVKADSGSSSGRASYVWPGGPVGEGLRTFGEALGLPADNPLTGSGYPIQVNSRYPGEPTSQRDEPFPGMVMRTTSGDKTAVAQTGFSPDGTVLGPEAGDAPKGGAPGGNPLDQLGELLGGGVAPGGAKTTQKTTQTADEPSTPGLPPELAALVDMDGYVSVSRIKADDGPVSSASRASLGEVRLLGGLITLGGVEAIARTSTDGAKGTATGKAAYGKLAIAGQEFEVGPNGAVAAGKPAPIPGLNDNPAKALDQLGISFEVPKPTRKVEGDAATSLSEGLRVIIDTKALAPVLSAIPAAQLAQLVPAEAGPLKGLVAGLSTLAPRVVLTLGIASATADTVPPIDAVAPPAPGGDTGTNAPPAAPKATSGSGGGATAGAPAAAGPAPAGGAPAPSEDVGALVDAAPASAGLPALFSIPGMLMTGAFIAAAVAGSWFRRIGAAALGAGASCPHGLDSGLPDLRKA